MKGPGAGARTRRVPLEAGIGPENPPCPACGEPLFGWVTAPAEPTVAVRRCESCGLGVLGDPGGAGEALSELEGLRLPGDGDPRYRLPNRSSIQASLGGRAWALLDRGARYLFTPEAVRRLVALRNQEVVRVRWRVGASLLGMWGTLLNIFTLGRNVALASLGRSDEAAAERGWQRALDGFISVALAIPVMLAAILLESGAALAGRGGVIEVTVRAE